MGGPPTVGDASVVPSPPKQTSLLPSYCVLDRLPAGFSGNVEQVVQPTFEAGDEVRLMPLGYDFTPQEASAVMSQVRETPLGTPFATCLCPRYEDAACSLLMHRVSITVTRDTALPDLSVAVSLQLDVDDLQRMTFDRQTVELFAVTVIPNNGSAAGTRPFTYNVTTHNVSAIVVRDPSGQLSEWYRRVLVGVQQCGTSLPFYSVDHGNVNFFPRLIPRCSVISKGRRPNWHHTRRHANRNATAGVRDDVTAVEQPWFASLVHVTGNLYCPQQQYHGLFELTGVAWLVWMIDYGLTTLRQLWVSSRQYDGRALRFDVRHVAPAVDTCGNSPSTIVPTFFDASLGSGTAAHPRATCLPPRIPFSVGEETTNSTQATMLDRVDVHSCTSTTSGSLAAHRHAGQSDAAREDSMPIDFVQIGHWYLPFYGERPFWSTCVAWAMAIPAAIARAFPREWFHGEPAVGAALESIIRAESRAIFKQYTGDRNWAYRMRWKNQMSGARDRSQQNLLVRSISGNAPLAAGAARQFGSAMNLSALKAAALLRAESSNTSNVASSALHLSLRDFDRSVRTALAARSDNYRLARWMPLPQSPDPPPDDPMSVIYEHRPRDKDFVFFRIRGVDEFDARRILTVLMQRLERRSAVHTARPQTVHPAAKATYHNISFHSTTLVGNMKHHLPYSPTFRTQLALIRARRVFLFGEGAFATWMLLAPAYSTFVCYYDVYDPYVEPTATADFAVIQFTVRLWSFCRSRHIRLIIITREGGWSSDVETLLPVALSDDVESAESLPLDGNGTGSSLPSHRRRSHRLGAVTEPIDRRFARLLLIRPNATKVKDLTNAEGAFVDSVGSGMMQLPLS